MERKEILKIPYVLHEAAMYRLERIIDRLIGAFVLSDLLFIATAIFLFIKKKR